MLIEKELYDKVCEITMTGYEEIIDNPGAKYIYASGYTMISIIEDLMYEIDRLQEKYEDLEQDLEDNYKPITKEEMYLG